MTTTTNKITADALIGLGGKLWEKEGKRRVYFNEMALFLGLDVSRYNTGNISYARLNGEKISNSQATRMLSAIAGKFWFDCGDGEFHWWNIDDTYGRQIADTITRKVQQEAVMKAIINGLRYNTESAVLVGKADYSPPSNHQRWTAALYKTPRAGRYFLAGTGGPMTRWARPLSDENNFRTGGSRIEPMSVPQAREWAERYLTTDEVETAFSGSVQDA